jgi:hypothetical protein
MLCPALVTGWQQHAPLGCWQHQTPSWQSGWHGGSMASRWRQKKREGVVITSKSLPHCSATLELLAELCPFVHACITSAGALCYVGILAC